MPHDTDSSPFDVLLIGYVTRDIIGAHSHLGGTVAFAAQAASCMGMRSAMVTAAPKDFPLLDPLRDDDNISLFEVPAAKETTFHLTYTSAGRSMRVTHRAPSLTLADVPEAVRQVPLALVAPLLGECDREVVQGLSARVVLCTIQGWLRTLGANGLVIPSLSELVTRPPHNLTVVVFSELDHPESEAIAQALAQKGVLVALTRSTQGVSLYTPSRIDVPAAPAVEVDPTGAGDVFGLVFGLALARGLGAVQAAKEAVLASARVVEGPGLGNLSAYVGAVAKRVTALGGAQAILAS